MKNIRASEETIKKGSVYVATNLINGKKYVGITTRPLVLRISEHKYDSKVNNEHSDTYFHKAIRKYGFENFRFDVLQNVESVDGKTLREKLCAFEKYYIELYKSKDKNCGYNLTDGGDGITGYIPTEEHRIKVGMAHKGKQLSEEHRQKIKAFMGSNKNPNIGRICSVETREKISKANKGKLSGSKNPMFGRKRPEVSKRNKDSGKKVCQINTETNQLISVWESLREAQRQTGCNRGGIRNCCTHKVNQSYGYKWMFYSEYQKIKGEIGTK